ncbi:ORF58 [Agrotis segetum granulovirus]|uniref:ORF58 n=1 Tax=Agrotis segetum granulosis virus TaxID=10464 RepID=Q6QXP1_GVAS|nr:hypothetical protein AsGV070 [Agrotis segetum granulovirus]AAS82680.1 ORF58 [Agrotis segetum granulovirus]AHN92109.1 hypothetical protein AsGV070 [Agrotis segetum granulovirus]AKN63344.1 hypothetical protein AsGV070 [Agrotis segetum granulovirus]
MTGGDKAMLWYDTYGFSVLCVFDLIQFKHYLEQIAFTEDELDIGRTVNKLVDTVWKDVKVCLEDELMMYYRLCQDCGEIGDRNISNCEQVSLKSVVCKKCGNCLVVQDPRFIYERSDAEYLLEEINEINNNPTDY